MGRDVAASRLSSQLPDSRYIRLGKVILHNNGWEPFSSNPLTVRFQRIPMYEVYKASFVLSSEYWIHDDTRVEDLFEDGPREFVVNKARGLSLLRQLDRSQKTALAVEGSTVLLTLDDILILHLST